MATNFEPNEYVIFVQSTKIDTHEKKAIHSKLFWLRFLNFLHSCITVDVTRKPGRIWTILGL